MSKHELVPSPIELIARRVKERSTPGNRNDGHRLKIGIEGGALSSSRTAGMVIALWDLGALDATDRIDPLSAANFIIAIGLGGNPRTGFRHFLNNHLYVDRWGAVKGKPTINVDNLADMVMPDIDFDEFRQRSTVIFRATSTINGASLTLTSPTSVDELHDALTDSSRTPVFGGRPRNQRLDGALEPGGLPHALHDEEPFTHGLYLLTRPEGTTRIRSVVDQCGAAILAAGGLIVTARQVMTYERRYAAKLKAINEAETQSRTPSTNPDQQRIQTIRVPSTEPPLSMTEIKGAALERGRQAGYDAVMRQLVPLGLKPRGKVYNLVH